MFTVNYYERDISGLTNGVQSSDQFCDGALLLCDFRVNREETYGGSNYLHTNL